MNMNELAIFGGSKIREKPFPHYPIITDAEKNNVLDVLNSQNLLREVNNKLYKL